MLPVFEHAMLLPYHVLSLVGAGRTRGWNKMVVGGRPHRCAVEETHCEGGAFSASYASVLCWDKCTCCCSYCVVCVGEVGLASGLS